MCPRMVKWNDNKVYYDIAIKDIANHVREKEAFLTKQQDAGL